MIECPSCALDIEKDAETCPFCGYEIPVQKPGLNYIAILVVFLLLWPLFKLITYFLG